MSQTNLFEAWFIRVVYELGGDPEDYIGPFESQGHAWHHRKEWGPFNGEIVRSPRSAASWSPEDHRDYVNARM